MNLFYFEGANLRIKIETNKDLRGNLACLIGGDCDLTDTPKFSGEIIEIIEIGMSEGWLFWWKKANLIVLGSHKF